MYFNRKLLGKGAIDRKAMPKFFGAWIDKAMPSYVFTPNQLRLFKLPELLASPWYLECAKNYSKLASNKYARNLAKGDDS